MVITFFFDLGTSIMKKIILASNSPRRKEILKSLNFAFTVQAPEFDEESVKEANPLELCRKIAFGKGQSVFKKFEKQADDAIIISADTLVFCDDKIFGKPKDEKDARNMLKSLSGQKHSVITAIFCMNLATKEFLEAQVRTYVYFKDMSPAEIDFYLSTNEWKGVAGAYRIQEKGAFFIKKIEGSYSNIVGLPIHDLYELLRLLNFEF